MRLYNSGCDSIIVKQYTGSDPFGLDDCMGLFGLRDFDHCQMTTYTGAVIDIPVVANEQSLNGGQIGLQAFDGLAIWETGSQTQAQSAAYLDMFSFYFSTSTDRTVNVTCYPDDASFTFYNDCYGCGADSIEVRDNTLGGLGIKTLAGRDVNSNPFGQFVLSTHGHSLKLLGQVSCPGVISTWIDVTGNADAAGAVLYLDRGMTLATGPTITLTAAPAGRTLRFDC